MPQFPTYCRENEPRAAARLPSKTVSTRAKRAAIRFQLLMAAFAQWLLVSVVSAQLPYLGITVIPPIPTAQSPYQIRVTVVTIGGPITIEDIVTTTNGTSVDITHFIHNASSNIIAVPYQGTSAGPPLAAGTYDFRYFVRLRAGDETVYRAPVLTYQKAVTVAPPDALADAIEYYHSQMDHYFTTAFANEIALLDSGAVPGWSRTGEVLPGVFVADPTAATTTSDLTAVCRFYGQSMPLLGTHFYSAFADECDAVSTLWPTQWLLETSSAYFAYPTSSVGQCPPGTLNVYRVFNNRPDANHRYTTSVSIRDAMVADGWIAEGVGPNAVVMCTSHPAAPSN